MDNPIRRFTNELVTIAGNVTEAQAADFVQRVYGVGRNEGMQANATDALKFQRQAESLRLENAKLRERLGLPGRRE
ncbi:regulator of replication initiation timing [Streptacidiphilus sp. MAP12-16]|jgi:hypothetical protein|uniref:hypothetical protein n=1 Tax=Streptacidiphilus sp. MAP12-16 TaxID=3156300 RepID=UPI00351965E9